MSAIQAIDKSSVHRLTSGQVVIDLQTAVKELVENALDAGAISIEVRFKEYGVDSFEVQDNGKGIEQTDWDGIALKHHTSKLTTFSDLAQVSTLGFRGEALSSLCGTAELSMITATALTAPVGTSLTFAPSGKCIVGSKAARPRGTTVIVKELFKTLPVRRKELIKNAKREFGKALELIQSYALVKVGCRIEVKNSVKGKWTTHLQTQPSNSLRSNFSSLFSAKALPPLMDLDLTLDVVPDKTVLKWADPSSLGSTEVLVKGLVSKPTTGNGRTSANRQFFYVNGRPFSPTKIGKTFNEVYKTFNTGSFPTVVADFQLPPDAYDVNVSPDKRTIFLHSETNLLGALKSALEELFQPSRSTYSMSQVAESSSSLRKTPAATRSSPTPDAELSEEEEERPSKRRRTSSLGRATPIDEKDEDAPEKISSASFSQGPTIESQEIPLDEGLNDLDQDETFTSISTTLEVSMLAVEEESETDSPPSSQPLPTRTRTKSKSPTLPSSPRSPTRSPSLSSSPPPPPPIKLRQITLDTTVASWAAPSSRQPPSNLPKASGSGSKNLKKHVKNLQRFLNPSQIRKKYIDDEAGVSGSYEDDEDDEEEEEEGEDDDLELDELEEEVPGDEEGDLEEGGDMNGAAEEEDSPAMEGEDLMDADEEELESDEDLIVVEQSFVASQGKSSKKVTACECDHDEEEDDEVTIVDASSQSQVPQLESQDALDDEQEDHLAELDSAGKNSSSPLENDVEVVGVQSMADVTVDFDFSSVAARWNTPNGSASGQPSSSTSPGTLTGASVDQDDAKAEATLARVVNKTDFEAMRIVGQFNLGFIIARRTLPAEEDEETVAQDDLFIIDQHASDEKYNFEKLQVDTVIQSQRLLQPRSLNLPSHEEIVAIENVDILKLNGFDVLINEDADIGQRVKLLAQPVSKSVAFGVEDLEELLDLINASSAGEVVRPSKTRKMFASRACRKSVMIGKALNANQMKAIVCHMGGMEQPWSCPHGRPTMRWLAGLGASAPDRRQRIAESLSSLK